MQCCNLRYCTMMEKELEGERSKGCLASTRTCMLHVSDGGQVGHILQVLHGERMGRGVRIGWTSCRHRAYCNNVLYISDGEKESGVAYLAMELPALVDGVTCQGLSSMLQKGNHCACYIGTNPEHKIKQRSNYLLEE